MGFEPGNPPDSSAAAVLSRVNALLRDSLTIECSTHFSFVVVFFFSPTISKFYGYTALSYHFDSDPRSLTRTTFKDELSWPPVCHDIRDKKNNKESPIPIKEEQKSFKLTFNHVQWEKVG